MKYAWQLPGWPQYQYSCDHLQSVVIAYNRSAGRLMGEVSQIQSPLRSDALIDLMVSEAIKTSAIEGEKLNREDVRSSIKNCLGLHDPPKRVGDTRAEGVAALMVGCRQQWRQPLSHETLFDWHKMILHQEEGFHLRELNIGHYRNSPEPMQIVSGAIGYERVHYEAPPSCDVPGHMDKFLHWFNGSAPDSQSGDAQLNGPTRAALAHLWFETIHPFDDGNGRIGRAIAEKALSQDLGGPSLASLSAAIDADRSAYYEQLSLASQSLDITPWIEWFTGVVAQAQTLSSKQVAHILNKSRFWDHHRETPLNNRQQKAINKMFDTGPEGFEGGMSPQKYGNLTRCSKATATRDLVKLKELGCLQQVGEGRATRYQLKMPDPNPFLHKSEVFSGDS